jgi:hypothetical protein
MRNASLIESPHDFSPVLFNVVEFFCFSGELFVHHHDVGFEPVIIITPIPVFRQVEVLLKF